MKDDLPKTKWKVNDVIRHLDTGHPYLILYTSNYFINVVDLLVDPPLAIMLTLLPRHYEEYALDSDIKLKKNEVKELEDMRMVFSYRQCFI